MIQQVRQQQYERAAAIARRDSLQVVAHGTRKSDGAAVYAVPSRSQANTWHLVVVEGLRLTCDCTAARHGRYCAHRAATRARLELEAQVRRDVREREQERALHVAARALAEAERANRRETAPDEDTAFGDPRSAAERDREGGPLYCPFCAEQGRQVSVKQDCPHRVTRRRLQQGKSDTAEPHAH